MGRIKHKSGGGQFTISKNGIRPGILFLCIRLVLFQLLFCYDSTLGFDLISTLMAQSPSLPGKLPLPNIKSLVSPELLSKMKGLLPSLPNGGQGHTDVAQIEKLLAKLKPAEGRFDPQMLELLAHMDSSRVHPHSGDLQSNNNKNKHNAQNHNSKNGDRNERVKNGASHHHHHHENNNNNNQNNVHDNNNDDDYQSPHSHHHSSNHDQFEYADIDIEKLISTSSAPDVFTFTTPDSKPKFSSKFRLDEAKEPTDLHHHYQQQQLQQQQQQDNAQDEKQASLDLNHVIDPNIRNHRLYELDQERFETYENFTALDQMEDLLAEESSHDGVMEVIVPPPPSFDKAKAKIVTQTKKKMGHPTPTVSSNSNNNNNNNNGWIGRPYSSVSRKPAPSPSPPPPPAAPEQQQELTPTTFSYEDEMASLDSSVGDDEYSSSSSQSMHDREPLKHASTEKTVIYPQNYHHPHQQRRRKPQHRQSHNHHHSNNHGGENTQGEMSYEKSSELLAEPPATTTTRFKPSPVDLSPPFIFEPDQDFYTSTISKKPKKSSSSSSISSNNNNGGISLHLNNGDGSSIVRRRQPNAMEKSSSPASPTFHQYHHNSNNYNPNMYMNEYSSSTDMNMYSDQPDYPKEQPNFQNAMTYHKTNLHPTHSSSITPVIEPQIMHPNNKQNHNPHHNNNVPMMNMNIKQDRILPGLQQVQQHFTHLPSMFYSAVGMGGGHNNVNGGAMRNSYIAEGSDNVYHDVHMNPYRTQLHSPYQQVHQQPHQHQQQQPQQQASNDMAYSAGQNYHNGWPSTPGYYVESSSSWSSTFLLLGGLIALSAVIAFLLPSIVTGTGTGGGKDVDDKVDNNVEGEPDLWTEIKGLYGDIVSIAKGDYVNIKRQKVNRHRNNLVNNHHQHDDEGEEEEEEEEAEDEELGETEDPTRIGKRNGQAGKLVDRAQIKVKREPEKEKGEEHEKEEEENDVEAEEEEEEVEGNTTLSSSSRKNTEYHGGIQDQSEELDESIGSRESKNNKNERGLVVSEPFSSSTSRPVVIQQQQQQQQQPQKKESKENINDTLAFGVHIPGKMSQSSGMDFANAFNQTLLAWEKVPLIGN